MKNIILEKTVLLLAVFVCLPFIGCSQTRILNVLPPGGDITKVYISKAMVGSNKDYIIEAFEGSEGIEPQHIEGIEIYSCTSPHRNRLDMIMKGIVNLLAEYDAVPLIEKEEGNLVSGYFILYKDKKEIGTAILYSNDKEIKITVLHGKTKTK